jgi:hypothetical protein
MPYSVQLIRRDKTVLEDFRVFREPTTNYGTTNDVENNGVTYRGKVIGIAAIRVKSPQTEYIDHVRAEEVW